MQAPEILHQTDRELRIGTSRFSSYISIFVTSKAVGLPALLIVSAIVGLLPLLSVGVMVVGVYDTGQASLHCQRLEPRIVQCQERRSRLLGFLQGSPIVINRVSNAEVHSKVVEDSDGDEQTIYWLTINSPDGKVKSQLFGSPHNHAARINEFLDSNQERLTIQTHNFFLAVGSLLGGSFFLWVLAKIASPPPPLVFKQATQTLSLGTRKIPFAEIQGFILLRGYNWQNDRSEEHLSLVLNTGELLSIGVIPRSDGNTDSDRSHQDHLQNLLAAIQNFVDVPEQLSSLSESEIIILSQDLVYCRQQQCLLCKSGKLTSDKVKALGLIKDTDTDGDVYYQIALQLDSGKTKEENIDLSSNLLDAQGALKQTSDEMVKLPPFYYGEDVNETCKAKIKHLSELLGVPVETDMLQD